MKYKLLLVSFILVCCKQSPKKTNTISDVEYNETSINEVFKSPHLYNSKKVVVEGYFHFRMEDSSLSGRKTTNLENRIWLEFNFFSDLENQHKKLFFKDDNVLNYTGKKVRIKGVYDTQYKGHLSAYSGSIKVDNFIYEEENYTRRP